MYEKLYQKRKWGWLQMTAIVFAMVALVGALVPTLHSVAPRANQAEAIGNCKQIVSALRIYEGEHGGRFPDRMEPAPANSNQAFRVLFREDIIIDEKVFGCPMSPFMPDGKIGGPPDYPQALEAGENHWAMTKGVTYRSSGLMPIIFENPVAETRPLVWDAKQAGKKVKGRTWRNGSIVMGFNDSSVRMVKIDSLPSNGSKKDVFTDAVASMEILDIEE